MEVFVVTETDETVDEEEIVDLVKSTTGLDDVALVSGSKNQFRSVLDWAATMCRAHHKLGRKLILELEDQGAVYKVLLQAANKDLTGDSDFVVSDLLEVEAKVKKARVSGVWPEKSEGVVGEAVGRYKDFLKQCGLADRWEVITEVVKCLEGERKGLVVMGMSDEEDLLTSLSDGLVKPVILKNCSATVGESTLVSNIGECMSRNQRGYDTLATLASFLRLLVCSRDELSLARAVTDSNLLTNQQFTMVRREAETVKMSMYQTIVSFVRKVGLGGKSYQPGEENSMHNIRDSLVEFNRIMEKLQEKMEETSGAVAAVISVVTVLRSWLVKHGVEVDRDLVEIVQQLSEEVERRLSSLQATPARGLMGRPAVKLLTGLVDLLASAGKVQTKLVVGKTPARQAKLVENFKTPQPDAVLDPDDDLDCLLHEKSLTERLGGAAVSETIGTPVARPAYPRFKTCNDFTEGSPALLGSGDRGGTVTGGRTLIARAGSSPGGSPCSSVESTRRILQEVKEKEELEEKEKMERAKEGIKKTKRCLAKEVDGMVREKMGIKRKKDGDTSKENKEKQPLKKKKFSTPKGQKKMTSFFKR